MTPERFNMLMMDEGELTPEELENNWHFCWDFDGLLMQGLPECCKDDSTCICGYKLPKKISEQTEEP